ncbi:MAG: FAD-dependent thymidylate synthase [Clostridia bacterium]|nr:FAD-dependent thymidylate synthase [Clostridia bacterium]
MKVKFLSENSERSLKNKIRFVAASAKLSHFNGTLSELYNASQNHEENLKVIGRITRSGHKSILEHHYINLELSEVTPIVEQTLIGFRLPSFTIKSRRYVDFRKVGYYIPEFKNIDGSLHMENELLKKKYRRHMNYLFKFYSEMVDGGIIKEDARFILPYSFYSEIAMSVNAREFEKMINYLLYGEVSKIQELHDLGEAFFEIAKQHVPEIVEYIENYHPRLSSYDYHQVLDTYKVSTKVLKKPVLIDYTADADDVILETAVMGETQCNYDEAGRIITEAELEDPDFRAKYMDAIVKKQENRELEQVTFTWQLPISLSILTHLTRQRMHSLITPNFVPLWDFQNYIIPDSIKNSEFLDKYQRVIEKNMIIMSEFKNAGVVEEDLVYFYLGCQMCNVITTINGRELMWLSRLRGCNRAQWQIRQITNYMIEETRKVAPLLGRGLGPTCRVLRYCPEGKLSCGLIKEILAEEKKKE